MSDLHRLRFSVDVIYDGPKLSPSAARRVAEEVSTHAHVLAFEGLIENVEVQHTPRDERVVYAHHHEGDGGCRVDHGCLAQYNDGFSQEDL